MAHSAYILRILLLPYLDLPAHPSGFLTEVTVQIVIKSCRIAKPQPTQHDASYPVMTTSADLG